MLTQPHRRKLYLAALMLLALAPLTASEGPHNNEKIEALLHSKSTAEARRVIEPLIRSRPESAELRAYLALSYVHENRWESASQAYADALRLEPSGSEYRLLYGWSLYYLGRLEASREQFDIFLKDHEDFADAIFAVGLIDFDQDRMDDAETRFKRVISIARAHADDRRHAMARARLADVFLRKDNPSRARLELKQALELDPTNAKAQFKMSRVLQLLGHDEQAAAARLRFEALRDNQHDDAPRAGFPDQP
jgi:Tfp pilus assembly protein PilF